MRYHFRARSFQVQVQPWSWKMTQTTDNNFQRCLGLHSYNSVKSSDLHLFLRRPTTSTSSCAWPSSFCTGRTWRSSYSPPTRCSSTSATSPCTWTESWCCARYCCAHAVFFSFLCSFLFFFARRLDICQTCLHTNDKFSLCTLAPNNTPFPKYRTVFA